MFFLETLEFDCFEGADFKYDNSFFKILAQKYPNKVFLVQNLSIFVVFFRKFPNKTNSMVLISNMMILFSNSSPKIPEHAFLVPNLGIFIFS